MKSFIKTILVFCGVLFTAISCSRDSEEQIVETDPALILATEMKSIAVGFLVKTRVDGSEGDLGVLQFEESNTVPNAVIHDIDNTVRVPITDSNYQEGIGFIVESAFSADLTAMKFIFKKVKVGQNYEIILSSVTADGREIKEDAKIINPNDQIILGEYYTRPHLLGMKYYFNFKEDHLLSGILPNNPNYPTMYWNELKYMKKYVWRATHYLPSTGTRKSFGYVHGNNITAQEVELQNPIDKIFTYTKE